ncbi:MAG: aldo/keto reductase [Desulfovibrionaceae bacterium]|nr:aldo/keto reductase [Desulfovibrionaceae bacterium]MBF0512948.1 aldo/keto reductase [Desulfovibrionaceae bacterium]
MTGDREPRPDLPPRRPFGETGLDFRPLGLGAWQIGTGWGRVSDEDALGVLRAARESGVDFIDTADVYGDGRSERLIGRVLAEGDWRPFVATKVGRWRDPGWPGNFRRDVLRAQVRASLARLGVKRLDLLQLHTVPFEILRQGEIFEQLRELQAEGAIRYFGASVESMDEAFHCLGEPGLTALQIIFNVFRQKPAEALFAAARAKGVALIARTPLASGLATAKFKPATTFAGNDHRHFNRDGAHFNPGETFAGLPFEKGVALARELREFRPVHASMAQFALRYILDFPEISVVIPGARKAAQVLENMGALALKPLSPETHGRLADYYRTRVAAHIRGAN